MKPLLLVAFGRTISAAPLGRREDDIEVRRVPALPTAAALAEERRPIVVVLDRALLQSVAGVPHTLEGLAEVAVLVGMGYAGEQEPGDDFPVELLTSFVAGDAPVGALLTQLRGAFRHAAAQLAERNAREQEKLRSEELTELTRVGVALSHERDLTKLLEMILGQARRITNSDAGSLYLAERTDDGSAPKTLRFKLSQNFSLPNLPFSEYSVPIDHASLSGYVAATGQPLVIADVYLLPEDVSYRQNRSFDERFGYRTKSMLVLPMRTHKDDIVGVLQLINRKRQRRGDADFGSRRRERGAAVQPALRGAGERAGVAGGGRHREQPAVRGHRGAVRGLRHGRGHRDRVPRPDDVRSFRARGDAHGRARAGGGPWRPGAVQGSQVLARSS